MSEIKTYVESIFDELVAIRRDIHAHPEVGMTEVRTSAMFWLTNRRPDRWKYKPQEADSVEDEGHGVVMMPEVSGDG